MTDDKEAKDVEKNIVVVGIRMDSYSRELLNWALVKVAEPGDKVLACHVCNISGAEHSSKEQDSLDKYLEVYKGLCSVNKVDLTGEILTGNLVHKSLVRKAKNLAAKAVIVGIRNRKTLRGRASTARYCARNLPPATDVLAIQKGKIVFKRLTNSQIQGLQVDPRPSIYLTTREIEESLSEVATYTMMTEKSRYEELRSSGGQASCSYEELEGLKLRAIYKQHQSFSNIMTESPEERPGWPLLLRTNSAILSNHQARNMSVVQWVMSLPGHSLSGSPKKLSTKESRLEGGEGEISDNISKVSSSSLNNVLECSELLEQRCPFICKHFSHEHLIIATAQFSSENLIGKGGCNSVYKGILGDGKPVAVKVLRSTKEAQREFSQEVDIMSSLEHKHILPLLGVCTEDDDLISVYEFMPRGSLEHVLHNNANDKSILSWEIRFKVAVGIAEALYYLHSDCARPVIHRDIKSSNILLSDGFEPQLSDFGLAIWGPTSSPHITEADIVGTFGYLAPEYFMYGKVSDKIDVYAYGVVLLELLSGRKPICSDIAKGQGSLVMWAKPLIENGDVGGLLDPRLDGQFDEAEMKRMVLAATLCISQAARLRPTMEQVLKILRGEIDIQDWLNSNNGTKNMRNNDDTDDEVYPKSSAESHLSLAFLDIDDDSESPSSLASDLSFEECMRERWSRTSSLN